MPQSWALCTSFVLALACAAVGCSSRGLVETSEPTVEGALAIRDALRAERLAAGTHHTCALDPNGELRCWGGGGLAPELRARALQGPTPIGKLPHAASIAGGSSASCALANGDIYCFGDVVLPSCEGTVQVGDPAVVPTRLCGVVADERTSLAMNAKDELCFAGERGVACVDRFSVKRERAVFPGSGERKIALSSTHGCAADGASMVCWDDAQSEPIEIDAARALGRIDELAAGERFTCVASERGVFCMGANDHGTLGAGLLEASQATPVRVVGLPEREPVTKLAAGAHHVCAIAGGRVYCWGADRWGETGYTGKSAITRRVAMRVEHLPGEAIDLALGAEHSCASTTSGVYCWGRNDRGQLGAPPGQVTQSGVPRPVPLEIARPVR